MGNLFLILSLFVFVMLLYVYVGNSKNVEKFVDISTEKLIPSNKIVVIQGMGVPDVPIEPSQPDENDISAPAVDGTENGPKSKFMFAYNECKPECCTTSGGYSCNGGCPCLTEDQKKFAFGRGKNNRPGKCSYDDGL